MTLFNWTRISEALTGNPRQIRSNYSGKMYREIVSEIRTKEAELLDLIAKAQNGKKAER